MEITAAVMTRADGMLTRRKIRLEQVELDDPRENEVLVRISSCGICCTDRGAIHGLEPYPADIDKAIDDSDGGRTIKPILKMNG